MKNIPHSKPSEKDPGVFWKAGLSEEATWIYKQQSATHG